MNNDPDSLNNKNFNLNKQNNPWTPPGDSIIIDRWKFDHYGVKEYKSVGIWPADYSVPNLKNLRNHWGYSKIFINPDQVQFDDAISAGYSKNDIMVSVTGIPDSDRLGVIKKFGNVFAYYVDEPADQNHSIRGVKSAIKILHLNSLFVISGYKRTGKLNDYSNQADAVMFSSYHHWYKLFPGIWVSWPENKDQAEDWFDMQRRYGRKFSMTWINSYEVDEFDRLFKQAKKLKLDAVWIYTLDKHQTDQFQGISDAAFRHGFLRKFNRKWRDIYKCKCPDGCYGFSPNNKCWVYERSEDTNQFMEIFPDSSRNNY
jgi:hypothetical protein